MKLKLCATIVGLALPCIATSATTLDDLGVTLFRAVTTNLDGRDLAVAQSEASLTADWQTWQVNPAATGRSADIFTYASTNGSTNVFPNNIGKESGHADGVGQMLYGIPNGIATNLSRVDNSEADYFVNTYILSTLPPPVLGDPIVNQSFSFGPLSVADQQQVDSGYDDYAAQYGTLFLSAVNNHNESAVVCAPGTAYNCIGVGAFTASYNNSIGPTPDNGRCKPDISGEWGDVSTTTAQVSGAAAVLMQAALRGDGGSDTNSAFDLRTIKALLINGAVKPAGWTNSTTSPLDTRYGSGVFNLFNSYEQLIGGKQGYTASGTVSVGGAHPSDNGATGTVPVLIGWDLNTCASSVINDRINHYYFNVTNANGATSAKLTATLVWNRQQNQSSINNLNLFLYNVANGNLISSSVSTVDNVEHIYVTNLPVGRYDLQVWKAGGLGTVSSSETYALAWDFALPPGAAPMLTMTKSGAKAVLNWPILPNGFVVQSTTNLNSPTVWSTNDLPAGVYSNQQNYIFLNPTNGSQFFRLVWP